MYGLFVLLGMGVSVLVARTLSRLPAQRDRAPTDPAVQLAAIVGAGLGAHLAHMVPTAWGWIHQPTHLGGEGLSGIYGRSILGGLLGGWAAVEIAKWKKGLTASVGPTVAAPLAAALCLGRVGCSLAGCCGGIPYAGPLALHDAQGTARFPVQPIEVFFHGAAFCWLLLRALRGKANELDLVGYLAAYGALRFALETVRWHGALWWGLSWYQVLSLALFFPAMTLFVRRLTVRSRTVRPRTVRSRTVRRLDERLPASHPRRTS